jgi:hypothetical protein
MHDRFEIENVPLPVGVRMTGKNSGTAAARNKLCVGVLSKRLPFMTRLL